MNARQSQTGHHPKYLTAAVTLAAIVMTLDITIIQLGLPKIAVEFDAGLSTLQWVFNGYTLAFASLLLAAGALGDRLGRLGIFQAGAIGFLFSSALCAIASHSELLIVGRVAQGVSAAMMFGTALSLIAGAYPRPEDRRDRQSAIVVFSSLSAASAALGPVVGGALVNSLGWRSMFYLNIPVCLIVIYLTVAKVDPQQRTVSGRRDIPAPIVISLALFAINFALSEATKSAGANYPLAGGCAVVGILLIIGFLAWEKRMGSDALLDLSLFKIPVFNGAVLMSFVCRFASFGIMPFQVIWLQAYLGLTPFTTGLTMLFTTLTMVVFAAVSMKLLTYFSTAMLNAMGMFLLGAGIVLGGFMVRFDSWPPMIPAWLVMGIGAGLMTPHMMDLAVSSVPAERSGMASGTANTFFPLGTATGVACLSAFLSWRMSSAIDSDFVKAAISGNREVIAALPADVSAEVHHLFTTFLSEGFWVVGALTAASAFLIYRLINDARPAVSTPAEPAQKEE